METDATGARAQLNEFDQAVRTTTQASVRLPSPWAFPLVACLGPAAVLGTASWRHVAARPDQPWLNVFRVAAVILGVIAIVAAFKEWRVERSQVVRPRPGLTGNHMSKWLFAFSFSTVVAFMVPLNLLTINDYEHALVLAVCSYLWLVFVPAFFFRRHVNAISCA